MAITSHVYERLAGELAAAIRRGDWRPGQCLPTVRALAAERGLDPNTVNRAYRMLAQLGLVEAHARRGTVVRTLACPATTGAPGEARHISCDCSHDFGMNLLARQLQDAGVALELRICGSTAALRALASGETQLAGCHLIDDDGQHYNHDAAARLLPGRPLRIITLAERSQGLIVRQGNPLAIRSIADLARPGIRLANRQSGSGTRVLLDRILAAHGLTGAELNGYDRELPTHLAVAAAIASGSADVGFGVAAAAYALELDFFPITSERYELVLHEGSLDAPWFGPLIETMASPRFHTALKALGGYDTSYTAWIRSIRYSGEQQP
ncbi:MAG: GntR family transcriptional regulator [Chloroflexi bacterium]|nr:GntR family transcriptional regulator [Chloroflexota bacterium]